MKKIVLLFSVFILNTVSAFSQTKPLHDHSEIGYLSSFRMEEAINLRSKKDVSSPVDFRTLNHEGGMKVVVLEVLGKDEYKNEKGMWLYVLLTSPMWADDGTWIEENRKFLIFLPDDMPVFDFKK